MKPLDQLVTENENIFCHWSGDTTDHRFRFKTDCGQYIEGHEQEPLSSWRFCPLCGRRFVEGS